MSSKTASSVSPAKALNFSLLTALSLALVFVMVSSVGLQAPALLDDSYAVYPTDGRDEDWCEDQYEDDEDGCIADALCDPEYDDDDGTFEECDDVDEDDEDEDEGDYCDQYENNENACIADSLCDPEYDDEDGTYDDCEEAETNGGGNNGGVWRRAGRGVGWEEDGR